MIDRRSICLACKKRNVCEDFKREIEDQDHIYLTLSCENYEEEKK